MKFVIVANGDFPTHNEPLKRLQEADFIICCDGAASETLKHNITPNCIIGDLDSLDPIVKEQYKDLIIHISEQETNDQTKAFTYILEKIKKESIKDFSISILGATGKREDHTLGNISLLADYSKELQNLNQSHTYTIETVTNYGVFSCHHNTSTIKTPIHSTISIFAFDETLQIKSKGLEYPTDNVHFDLWWKATLNRTIEESYTLHFNHPSRIIIFTTFN